MSKTTEQRQNEWTELVLQPPGPERERKGLEAILTMARVDGRDDVQFAELELSRDKLLDLTRVLIPYKEEFKKVYTVIGESLSSEAAEAFMAFVKDIKTLYDLSLVGTEDVHGQKTVLPSALMNSAVWPYLKKISLGGLVITEHMMQAWCQSLCDRERPIEHLALSNVEDWHKDAWPVFLDAIPLLRLKHLDLSDIDQDEIYNLCEGLKRCDTLEHFGLSSRLIPTDRLFNSMDMALRQMPLLMSLSLEGLPELTCEQLVGLGRIVASRPSLKRVFLSLPHPPLDTDVKEFLLACGYHPNLKQVRFSIAGRIPQLVQSHINTSQSWRARCLVSLIGGATIERVGYNSSLWKIKRDLFRHLLTFLPEGQRE